MAGSINPDESQTAAIRYVQFHSILKDSDLFNTKAAREIYSKLPFRGPVAKFQELFDIKSVELKNQVNDLYSNMEIVERMENMDSKDYWYNRIYAIERNIGEVNSTLLFLSLIMVSESLQYLKGYKERVMRLMWAERHGMKAPDDVDVADIERMLMAGSSKIILSGN